MTRATLGTAAILAVSLATACSTQPSNTGRVTFQIATGGPTASGSLAPLSDITVVKGSDVLVISGVELVARKIEFERVEGSCQPPAASQGKHGDAGPEDADDAETEECPELRLGPLLLNPPLADGAETSFTVDLPAGRYEEVDLKIHKPTDAPADAAFVAAHPDLLGVSIRVRGSFNGTPFTFTTAVSTKIEVDFEVPIEVTTDGPTNVTLLMDVRGWFLQAGGASLLAPGGLTAGQRAQIEQNIRASFHAFRDQDGDGHRD